MAEPSPFLFWDLSTTLRPSFGYSDNPAMAQKAFEQGSSFLNAGAELMLFRLPTGPSSFNLYWLGDERRYLDSTQLKKEQLFVTQATYGYDLGSGWSTGLALQHVFVNQVIDLSSQDLGLGIGRAVGHAFTLRPSVRHALGSRFWIEFEGEGSRQLYDAPLDNYWEFVPRLQVGLELPNRSLVTLGYAHTWRPFDDSELLTPSREILVGTNTRIGSDRIDLRWRQNWDPGRVWSTTFRAFYVMTRDNGLGFFDYHRAGLNGAVQWAPGRWTFKLSARVSRYDYDAQLIAPDEDTTRLRDELAAEARVEFAVRPNLKLFGIFELDHSQGNVGQDNFTAHTAQAGVEWEF